MISSANPENRFYGDEDRYIDYYKKAVAKALNEGQITQDDADLIEEFVTEVAATEHVSPKRLHKLYYILINWREFLGPFRENNITRLYRGIEALPRSKNPDGAPRYKHNTVADYMRIIKRFYLWLQENGYTTIEYRKLRKIKSPGYSTMTKTAEMLLNEEEVRAILEACQSSRDRAFIACLYEGGFRVGELGKLRWRQVKFSEWNVVVNVNDKTGNPRYIPLVMARPYLAQWRNDYPQERNDDAHVFLTQYGKQLGYNGIVKQIKGIVRRAGITKKVTPHLFRHSRVTHLIQQHYSDSTIKLMLWGNIDTKMFRTYAHLTNEDIENEVAEKAGVTPPSRRRRTDTLEAKQCKQCYTINAPTYKFCAQCGLPLTGEAADKLRQAQEQAELLPEYEKLMEKFKTELRTLQS